MEEVNLVHFDMLQAMPEWRNIFVRFAGQVPLHMTIGDPYPIQYYVKIPSFSSSR